MGLVQKLYEDFAMRLGKNGKKKKMEGWRGEAGIYTGREKANLLIYESNVATTDVTHSATQYCYLSCSLNQWKNMTQIYTFRT